MYKAAVAVVVDVAVVVVAVAAPAAAAVVAVVAVAVAVVAVVFLSGHCLDHGSCAFLLCQSQCFFQLQLSARQLQLSARMVLLLVVDYFSDFSTATDGVSPILL